MAEAKKVELNKDELPEGWVASTLGDIASYIQRGKSPKYTEFSELPVVNQKCVRWHGIDREHLKYIHPDQFEKWEEKRFLQNGDLLWNSTGTGTIGRAAIVHLKEGEKLVADSHVTIVRSGEGMEPKYVHYWVMGPAVQNSIEAMQSGSTNQVELSKGAVESTPIPVAPPEQQKRIVAKIEELFSHIDAGIEALKKAKQLLKQYRQSVLKAAVTGELTKGWREARIKDDAQGSANVAGGRTPGATKLEPASQLLERILKERRQKWEEQQLEQFKAKGKMPKDDKWKEKYIEPVLPEDLELPNEWITASLDQLTEYITSGSRGWAKYYADSGATFIRAQNLKFDVLNLDSIAYVSLPDKAEGMRTRVKYGDLLITITGANVTKTGYVNIELDEAYVSQHVALCRPTITKCVKYLYTYLLSKDGARKKLEEAAYGAGKPGLNLDNLKTLQIALPSIEEQEEIVRLVEQRFVVIQRLDDDLGVQLRKAEKNKQSVLASAFSGQLHNSCEQPVQQGRDMMSAEA
ncbi:MAG: restriction endonuclease subunit S [Gammaproteobacteria bacterium]|nr:restriction endonuclease subunit S [Gammaproteobacteria bacterium]MDH5802815.1 restriction endonuclease subunit S [Gammaproteobacteria bacterium]